MHWDADKAEDGLRIRVNYPTPESVKGTLLIDGPIGSYLKAFFGPIPEFPQAVSWRDKTIAECMSQDSDIAGYIDHMYISKRLRGLGIGSFILEKALGELQELGADKAWLIVGPETPDRWEALSTFYAEHGFERVPDCGYNRNVMVARLNNPK